MHTFSLQPIETQARGRGASDSDYHLHAGLSKALPETALLALSTLSHRLGRNVMAKAEFQLPGGSIKDRSALGMILDAEYRGVLRTHGTIIDATAGNTGIGLALHGTRRGYSVLTVVPHGITQGKVDLLKANGATVVPATELENYREKAAALARELPEAWWVNQFDNLANQRTHYLSTAPELWRQCEGRLDAFVASVGTGGTLAGMSRYLKEKAPNLRTVCADPTGAAMYSWVTRRELAPSGPESIAEGIGQCALTENFRGAPVDEALCIPDAEAVDMLYFLKEYEGLHVGLSAAINVCAAARTALTLPSGSVVATVLCDSGDRYGSTLFNAPWLARHHLTPRPERLNFLGRAPSE